MKEFYEPMLLFPHPNTPTRCVCLPYGRNRLTVIFCGGGVEELRVRFPYFYIKAVLRGNDIYPEPNPFPMTVRNTWAPINLHSAESNYLNDIDTERRHS